MIRRNVQFSLYANVLHRHEKGTRNIKLEIAMKDKMLNGVEIKRAVNTLKMKWIACSYGNGFIMSHFL